MHLFTSTAFWPVALGFFGLGTGYFIWGGQALFGYPKASPEVNKTMGMWGFWMPGFMQFLTGISLFAGLTLFGTLRTPALYMAALAFTAYGVHWFALGWNRMRAADARGSHGQALPVEAVEFVHVASVRHAAKPAQLRVGLAGLVQARGEPGVAEQKRPDCARRTAPPDLGGDGLNAGCRQAGLDLR